MAATAAASLTTKRLVGKLHPSTTALLVCDIQERFRPLIHNGETVIRTAKFLTSVSKELSVPILATQQYTKVFGPTVTDCFANPEDIGTDAVPVFEKKLFSMMTPQVKSHFTETLQNKTTSFILVGIEAHVCVQQTALDLLEMGHDVHIVADGVSSQQPFDREIALQRMTGAGAFLTTAQSAAFMLMQSADHPNFKKVSKLVVEHMKLPNDFNDAMLNKK
eukprot:CAMPEP_0185732146 /NCGR_PEP_ID=MMETSP1171-20130828/15176_1 /TAXON_ID=374046 /ORGANISM="Helicotheca tamensis, Strain CCMP826" /LENGTH=219 /DNA_ID=CAMNT_0028401563 /DNA_START=153 /DNA_END=812 /DNA_ORIENTATION=-